MPSPGSLAADDVPVPPVPAYVVVGAATTAGILLAFPWEVSFWSDVLIEGAYFALVVVFGAFVRRLDVPLLEVGWMVFAYARLIDFLDELVVEPTPWLNPYAGGVLTICGLALAGAGMYVAVAERDERLERLEERATTLELLNRVLRHDVRNDMTVVRGNVEVVRDDVGDDAAERLRAADRASQHVVDLTATARKLIDVVTGPDRALEPMSLDRVLLEVIEEQSALYPEATIVREGPLPEVTVVADDLLPALFRNLVANAVQHNDAGTPEVRVELRTGGESATVRVVDDGPGLPDAVRDALADDAGLDATDVGMGLYFVHRLVDRYGGEVEFEDRDAGGTAVAVTLRRAGTRAAAPGTGTGEPAR